MQFGNRSNCGDRTQEPAGFGLEESLASVSPYERQCNVNPGFMPPDALMPISALSVLQESQ